MGRHGALSITDLFSDSDQDSLFVLPLRIIPLRSPVLHQARLVKNIRLESMVELFHDEGSGSGQLGIEDLPAGMGIEAGHPDMGVLRKLAVLPSFDVYSLRITLRELGIAVTDSAALKLSEEKNRELTEYMTAFTRPLIQQIYGEETRAIGSVEGLIGLFRDPDIAKAKKKLRMMADKLGIGLLDVPRFLEDYGDIFLSLSYYRQCLDRIEPIISGFLESLRDLRGNWQLRNDMRFMKTSKVIEATVNEVMAAITGRFENFDRSSQEMWANLSAERFAKVKHLIETYHTTIGGVLCGLSVKMSIWHHLFPSPEVGGPMRRAEFIMGDMKQGLENIRRIESSAPMLADLE